MLYQITDWDDAYANGAHIPHADTYVPRWTEAAAAFRAAHPPQDLVRGHLFLPEGDPRGLMVFIHGGYWMRFDPTLWSHLAGGAQAEGWGCVLPGYPLAPDARIADMPDAQLRKLGQAINAWSIVPNGSEGYRKAEVTRGGIDTRELSQQTMMANKVPGLYFIGEVVDVTGWLGGYNFQWAWASAMACAQALQRLPEAA